METVFLTRDGLEILRRKLEHLVKVVRPEATRKLAAAREHGDLSENAEYDAAKEDVADIDRRISQMQQSLMRVEIIETSNLSTKEIRILSKVKLLDMGKNREFTYTLVDPLQANPTEGLISVKSPIGKGLLGKKKGSVVSIEIPSGEMKLKVLEFSLSKDL